MHSLKDTLTRMKFYIVLKLNLNITPTREEFVRLNQMVQLAWITRNYKDHEDIFYKPEGYFGLSYPEGLICLDEYQSYAEDYDVVGKLANAGLDITESREEEINAGHPLIPDEADALIATIAEDDVDSWITHHGFEVMLKNGTLFAHFEGHSMGQGGIDYLYVGTFKDKAALKEYISRQLLASFEPLVYEWDKI